jgi:large repetitive protein
MSLWQLRARSTRQRRKNNKSEASSHKMRFDRSGVERLEPRLLLAADLSISKTQIAPTAGAAVSQGELISYQITVNNSGTAATNTTFTDILPAGETLIGASTSTAVPLSISGNTVTGNLGTLNAGGAATITIDALVNGQVAGALTNTASISSPDENNGQPILSLPVSTTINALNNNTAANLSITKTAANNNGAVSIGGAETYTITVKNTSANAANNVSVLDVLPAGATFQSGTVTGGTGATNLSAPTGNLETIDLGTLSANGTATITMAVTAPNTAGVMVNSATVVSSSGNSAVANASTTLATAVQGTTAPPTGNIDLSVTKSAAVNANGANTATSVGANSTYTITVTNLGSAAATGVVVSDVLPAGAQFISGTTSITGVNVSSSNGIATAILPTLGPGASATVTLTLTSTLAGALTDTAYVESSQPDNNQANNIASATTLITGVATPAVDLSVTKTAANPVNTVGANEVYTITVTNHSASTATGVVLSEVLPANATFVSANASAGGALNPVGNLITDRIGALAGNASETLTVTVTPTAAGVITDTAYVAGDQVDTNLANNVATLTNAVQGATAANVDLSITKTAANSNAAVAAGTNETYTITVTNNGTADATGVVANDVLPSTVAFVSGTTSVNGVNVSNVNGSVSSNLGTLAHNQTATLTITVTPNATGSITDTAYVESNENDLNQSNNSASVTTQVISAASQANLSIVKVAAPNPGTVGQSLTYTLIVTNTGAASAANVVVSDTLPSGVTFASGSTDVNGVNVTNNNGAVTANLGTVASGTVDIVTIVVTPTQAGTVNNTATISTSTANISTHTSASTQTTINAGTSNQANLSITKVAAPNPGTVGQSLTYTLIVTDTGAASADNVVVSDTLPSGVTFASGSTDVNGVNVTNNNGTVTANLGTVTSGTVDTVTIVVTPTQAGTVNNTATVSTTTANVSTHTSASTQTTVNAATNNQANLSIVKVASPNPGTVGQNLTYSLIVINTGPVAADNVVVSDTLPGGITFVSANTDVNGVNANNTNGLVTANLGTVAAGAIDTVTIVVTPTQAGTLDNTATITTSTANASTHTTATTHTTINSSAAQANLSISKTASPSPATVGQDLTYTITVTNAAGAANAAGVTVTDVLPSGVNVVSVSDNLGNTLTSNGTTIINTNGTITDTLGNVAAGAADTLTVVVTPSQTGTLTNTAQVATTTANSSQNTSATIQTTVNPNNGNQANLSITKTASPSPVTVGQDLTYTITVTNAAGAANAAGVTVTDVLPSGVNVVSVSDNLGNTLTSNGTTIVNANGTITDTLGNVAAGVVDTLTIVVTPRQTGTLTNTAQVSTTTANSSQNTSATIQTTVNPSNSNQANLSITKTASPSPGTVGQNLTYTIIVTNAAGAATAEGVRVIDTLPVGLADLVSATDVTRNVTLTATGAAIKDEIGTMAAGTSDTIVIVATPTKTGQITNTASVMTTTPNASNDTTAVVHTTINSGTNNGHVCFLNGQAGDNSDQTFLTNLYREVFGRDPDAGGFQFWLNFLQTNGGATGSGQSNAATRQQVINAFLGSKEYITHWVDCVFDEILGRPADKGAENFFGNQLSNGLPQQDMIVTILSSPEYFANLGSSNTRFVETMYTNLLGRPADPQGEQAWVNALNNGQLNRAQVVQAFLNSQESAGLLLDAAAGVTVGAPGSPATASYPIGEITGGGWDNLYFQGNLRNLNASAVDQFMGELEAGTAWQTVQQQMLALPQYFNAV